MLISKVTYEFMSALCIEIRNRKGIKLFKVFKKVCKTERNNNHFENKSSTSKAD